MLSGKKDDSEFWIEERIRPFIANRPLAGKGIEFYLYTGFQGAVLKPGFYSPWLIIGNAESGECIIVPGFQC